ncbi:MAG: DUF1501 domain-containing protein [Pirellulaceae bacterium]|nr:DUF1501 domain-containing protein [Pirellulaceae bacterium]
MKHRDFSTSVSRRDMLAKSSLGFGSLALAGLLQDAQAAPTSGLAPRCSHRRPKARAVIQLFQNGGPSQMDMFDPKPELTKRAGEPFPDEWERTSSKSNRNVLMASSFQFRPHGQSGMEFSDAIPHLSTIVDELCLIRSMYTEHNNHPFGINMFQTGKVLAGRPAMGSWICYALGTENQNLPGYIVLRDAEGYNTSGKLVWSSGWLPAVYQGTEFGSSGSPVPNMNPTRALPVKARQRQIKLLNEMNQAHRLGHPQESELEARIENFELAARMQLAANDILDISDETNETRQLYGLDNPISAEYGKRCLLARRLVEAGVRFVQVHPPPFQPWDHHADLAKRMREICGVVDQASKALILDLLRRGMLDEVLVIWAGEFGRLPITQGEAGRDHNRHAFSIFMAGGGFQGGHVHGATDDFGYASVVDRVSCADLHATILHQLGIDHSRLSYHHGGRDERLTDPEVTGARVLHELLV